MGILIIIQHNIFLQRIIHPDDDPLNIGERYWNLRDSVLNCELYLLRMIQFDAALDYPQNVRFDFGST